MTTASERSKREPEMSVFEHTLALIDSVGEPGFESAYFAVFDDLLGLWSCTAFSFRRHAPPKCIVAAGPNRQSALRVRNNAKRYVEHGYRDDPNLRFVQTLDDSGIEVRSLADAEFHDDSYRSRYFSNASTRDKVFILSAEKDRIIYANFYRGFFQRDFDDEDKNVLRKYARLCISLLRLHVKFGKHSSSEVFLDESRVKKTLRYRQVLDLLSKYEISPREAQICAKIVVGGTTQGISDELGISKNTVITHRRRAYEKLGVSNQNELFGKCFDVLSGEE